VGENGMKQVLYEEDATFRVGTILAEAGASFQIEAAHGKRSKVKASSVLLRFDGQPLGSFMAEAQRLSNDIDPQFLWEVSGADEFAFDALATEYFGRAPNPLEATAVALRLHGHPMYFYKRGKGRYQAAPEENLRAALAGLERKRRQQEQVDAWALELGAGRVPPPIGEKLDTLLFKPDRTSLEWRALDQAGAGTGLAPPRLLARAGALAGPDDYFLRRFAFEFFPQGTGFGAYPGLREPEGLDIASARAFSIDDLETTEIDDAFSVERLANGDVRIGVHIAAPTLYFGREHPLEQAARERLSTAYFPGGKITMLPEDLVIRATLAEGRDAAAASLYLTIDPVTFDIRDSASRLERVRVVANLRLGELGGRLNEAALAAGRVEGAHGDDLLLLARFAAHLRGVRGASEERIDRPDYTIRVAEGRVAIETRARGTPVDTLVAELMIFVNASWGKLLDAHAIPALYRNQKGGKTRMEVEPAAHEWLGVSHYAWASSPLRRYCDLANQRQLAALLRSEPAAYGADELATVAREFEAAYDAYAEHQRNVERYWTLRYVIQEGIEEASAAILRDDLVRIDGLPLVCRAIGLPPGLAPGEKVRVAFGEPDLWEPSVLCRYAGK
jgi:exoribonuclease-2